MKAGRKITKHLCGLEKRNSVSKQMMTFTLNDGSVLTETDEVVEEVNSLKTIPIREKEVEYCKISDFIANVPKLPDQERTSLEGVISLE